MSRFWNFKDLDEGVEMRLEGPISEDTWWGDEVTPAQFKAELAEHNGKELTIWINSPGGDVFAASVIYTAIKERKGFTKVKIDGMAASAASVVAMAGDTVEMSPTAIMLVHNPWTLAMGNENDLKDTISVLKEIKETIINAYQTKSNLSHDEISKLMDKETWMNAKKAVELGFADAVLYAEGETKETPKAMAFSQRKYAAQICAKIKASEEQIDANKEPEPEQVVVSTESILAWLKIEEELYNE